jgi:hypothetical protein
MPLMKEKTAGQQAGMKFFQFWAVTREYGIQKEFCQRFKKKISG